MAPEHPLQLVEESMMLEEAIGLKKKIRDGERVIGVAVPVMSTREQLARILDMGPFDFVSIDSQHTPLNEERLVEFCGIAEELDVFVQFRIKHTRSAYLSGNYLDLGPCGVEIPQTELDTTVQEALHSFYYPPVGGRSFGGAARRGIAGRSVDEYGLWWNSYGVLWLQIESVEATARAHLWARHTGIDCVSIGPVDLDFNIRSHPDHPFQLVDDCVRYLGRSLAGTGVRICHRNWTADTREKYADMGVTVFLELPPD